MNVIARLDFELANNDVAVQNVSHYATETPLRALSVLLSSIRLKQEILKYSIVYLEYEYLKETEKKKR